MSAKLLLKNFDLLDSIEKNGMSSGYRKLMIDLIAGDTSAEREKNKRDVQRTLILRSMRRHYSRKRSIEVISNFFIVPYSTIDRLWRSIEGELK